MSEEQLFEQGLRKSQETAHKGWALGLRGSPAPAAGGEMLGGRMGPSSGPGRPGPAPALPELGSGSQAASHARPCPLDSTQLCQP